MAEKRKRATFYMSASKTADFSHSLPLIENATRNTFTCSRETAASRYFLQP